jgi:hypothetical protein
MTSLGWLSVPLFGVTAAVLPSVATFVPVASLVLAVLVAVKAHIGPWIAVNSKRRSVERHGGARLFTTDGIEDAVRCYVAPFCQDVDPAGEEDLRAVVAARQGLFEALDDRLRRPGKQRYMMLLADSGMGKTSALVNFYVLHLRRWRKPFDLALVPLGDRRADEIIAAIEDKRNTTLFLDALDEDAAAIRDLPTRLARLVEISSDFRSVLITCRTQFFSSEQETPRKVGRLRFDARPAGEEGEYLFYKLYLAPLDDQQVSRYLKRRYPFWRLGRRRAAHRLVAGLSDLSARPMLLTHIDDILASGEAVAVQGAATVSRLAAVYDLIVRAWLQREAAFVEPGHLLEFSTRLAVDLVTQRDRRGGERIPRAELAALAEAWRVPLPSWQLTGRSLLNRDAEGNYKFAHRSIMEYLFTVRIADFDPACTSAAWTDLIGEFALQLIDNYAYGTPGPQIALDALTDPLLAENLLSGLRLSTIVTSMDDEPVFVTHPNKTVLNYIAKQALQLVRLQEQVASPDQPMNTNLARVAALLGRYIDSEIAVMRIANQEDLGSRNALIWSGGDIQLSIVPDLSKGVRGELLQSIANLVTLLRGNTALPCTFALHNRSFSIVQRILSQVPLQSPRQHQAPRVAGRCSASSHRFSRYLETPDQSGWGTGGFAARGAPQPGLLLT